jgi:aspartate kinase
MLAVLRHKSMIQKKDIIVAKFGGTSVADTQHICMVANRLKALSEKYYVIGIVSAMAGFTNKLVSYCDAIAQNKRDTEVDAVLAAGEQITSGLLALKLKELGLTSSSYMGWQLPIKTKGFPTYAQIHSIDTEFLFQNIAEGVIPIIAGFQGVTYNNRITTLGRGGSDTTAVALTAALQNKIIEDKRDYKISCHIYTDVDGVYTADPRFVPKAKHLKNIPLTTMLEFAQAGSKVLDMRSVQLALKYNVNIKVLSSFLPDNEQMGTLIKKEEKKMETALVYGITHNQNDYLLEIHSACEKEIFQFLKFCSEKHIKTDLFTLMPLKLDFCARIMVPSRNMEEVKTFLESTSNITYHLFKDKVKVSIIGIALQNDPSILEKIYSYIEEHSIKIDLICISETKIAFVIDQKYTSEIVENIHNALIPIN